MITALAMPFLDPSGDTHPDMIWLPGTVVMDNLDQSGGVDWVGYHSPAAFAAGASPVQGAQHHTALDKTLYGAVVGFPCAAGTYGAATATALTYLAVNVKDVDSGTKDANGLPVLVSFFAAATAVQLG